MSEIREYRLGIEDEAPCIHCSEIVRDGPELCPNCGHTTLRLGFDQFFGALDNKQIVDARYGGLVLGRTGPEDDIPMWNYVGGGLYALSGLMQGGEYILCDEATDIFREELTAINNEKGDASQPPVMPHRAITTINSRFLHGMPSNLIWGLWIAGGQFIINRYATARNMERLEEMNLQGLRERLSRTHLS